MTTKVDYFDRRRTAFISAIRACIQGLDEIAESARNCIKGLEEETNEQAD